MKKIILVISTIFIAAFSFFPSIIQAQGADVEEGKAVEYLLFHLETCPHCKDEIKFINKKLLPKYGDYIDLQMYEVSDPKNQDIFKQYQQYYNVSGGGVPLAIVAGEVVYGYGTDKTTGAQIMNIVERELVAQGILDKTTGEPLDLQNPACDTSQENPCITIPGIGVIDPQSFSLPLLTVIIGLLDGFNPCAMWVLLFLISLLLGMEDKRRMWLLGSIFIVSSGIVYFIFMAAWLQFILFIGMIGIIRLIIGGAAVVIGGKNLNDFWKNRKADGVVCEVSNKEGTKKTFEKIKDIVHRKSLWWSILGIIILGFSVNLVELACSAGFPAIFTQVLALNDLPMWHRYLYMVGYIIFYMLDDMIVFILAMLTLKSKVIGGKYAKYANLVGGLLIFILGILLILKPEWLMFG